MVQVVTAAVGRMNLCAVNHDVASPSAGFVTSTVTVKMARMRRTVVRKPPHLLLLQSTSILLYLCCCCSCAASL